MNILDMSQFKTLAEIKDYAEELTRLNVILQNDIKQKDDKIKHLESLLNVLPATDFIVEDREIEICKIEINRLYQKSLRIPLEDKEVRNLEIYVRTLALARGKSVEDTKAKKEKEATKNIPVGKLIELAKTMKND